MNKISTTFTTKIYGVEMSGTVDDRGWAPDRKTKIALNKLDADKTLKAKKRIKKISEEALAAACAEDDTPASAEDTAASV